MSGKIRSKDLSYDSSLPPFLQRLQAQNAGRGDADRHEQPVARPKRAKDPNEDDGPTVVDETGEMISMEALEQKVTANDSSETNGDAPKDIAADSKLAGYQRVSGTASKKRKVAKVVGDDDESASESKSRDQGTAREATADKKIKKRNKPIKLAFDEDEGG